MSDSNVSQTLAIPATETLRPELRPCPLCGSRVFKTVFEPIGRCGGCGLSFVNPLGEFSGENETPEYFLNNYLPLHLANREDSLAERRAHIASIKRHFLLPSNPHLLDVGCALGFMLQEAKAAGWRPTGVETSEFAAKYAEQQSGCKVYSGTLQQNRLQAESFDVITLMDVIEHVPEPQDLIAEIYRVLRPGGVLYIVTPNFGSLFVRLYGRTAFGIWPEHHVVYFKPSTIRRLLNKVGFKSVTVGSKDFYADNLKRFLRRANDPSVDLKSTFGERGSLGGIRDSLNRILMWIPIGDKLIAFAQKQDS